MFFNRRHGARESLVLHVMLEDGVRAMTRDIGPQGLFLQLPRGVSFGQDWVRFEFGHTDARLKLHATGEVLRIERRDNCGLGIALRLHSMQLRPT